MKVFIINSSGHDFSKAEKFGELVVMTEGTVNKYSITSMARNFQPFIEESQPDDFLLQSGPVVLSMIAASMFAEKHGILNLLLWRSEEDGNDRYVQRTLRL
ncbi:hypothetical protein HN911_13380 [Candidatus Bathyarchaeota archaeon]|jgi:hypothetical protein|nr:hypothetical protein [Candidatus Bathyarchaeota archaeon]